MDDYPMYGLLVRFSLWGTLWRLLFPLGFWNTFMCRVETRGGASTTPYTKEQEEEAAKILVEQKAKKEKREVVKQAKKLALLEEQATKKKKFEEELEKLKREEEEKLKARFRTRDDDAHGHISESEDGEHRAILCRCHAKLTAPREEEVRPRKDPVKVKFPDSYSGKKGENFNNREGNIYSYVHLQKILPKEQVLIAFHALKDEAANFALSLANAAKCDNDIVAYFAITPLNEFFKLLRERFADVTRGIRASNKLQTVHSRQWKSARALKGVMDELVAVPDHGVTETQLVQPFYRVMPEPLRGHFFEKSKESTMTYDTLSREVVAFEAQSMPATFWHKDLDKGQKWKGRPISNQVKAKDHLILTLDEGDMDEVPYDQMQWGLEEEGSGDSQGRTYAAVTAGGRSQGRGGGRGQGGQASGGRGQSDQGVGSRGNRQVGGRGQVPRQNRSRFTRSPPMKGGWHLGLPQGRPWEDLA
ncbi:hypothetical protein CBR_g45814 [Chara braunii]|uniref:Uncharacterized protein n=1 Tax=Chara braunii TaxID=69332 RepID=A0A388LZG8_CHABU|nr:hypothetical protein CBR_g45814 [Chara braunii]|eukprot:GBG87661.1 hypothetical protein CBR_g45814 [Chara braunii]